MTCIQTAIHIGLPFTLNVIFTLLLFHDLFILQVIMCEDLSLLRHECQIHLYKLKKNNRPKNISYVSSA
jgi:hypothetical protein